MLRLMLSFAVIITALCSCATQYKSEKISESTSFKKTNEDKFKIEFERKLFTYFTEINDQKYVANGTFSMNKSLIEFEFPAFSEYKGLPFFSKEEWNLKWIDTSEHFEIDILLIDADTKKEITRHIPISISPRRFASVIRPEGYRKIIAKSPNSKIDLVFFRPNKGKDNIEIPKKGKYQLVFYMLSPKTKVSYTTTSKACFMETSNPIVTMTICEEADDGVIESFDFNPDCLNKYVLEK